MYDDNETMKQYLVYYVQYTKMVFGVTYNISKQYKTAG